MAQRLPNILLICTDHFRADALGCAGHPLVETPHLDRLARRGMRFTRAYCASPQCIPARTSLFSGLYPHTIGKVAHVRMEIDPRIKMLPQYLAEAGYRTGIVGKTHFWPPTETYGSEYARLTIDRHLSGELGDSDAYVQYLGKRGLLDLEDEGTIPLEHYRTLWTANEASAFLRSESDRPCFLFCSFVKPHPPFDPPEPYDTYYAEADIPLPVADESEWRSKPSAVRNRMDRSLIENADRTRKQAIRYFGLLTLIDTAVGRILEAIEQAGNLENTIVVFTSDHGEYLGDHWMMGKEFFHDSSARIPLIVAGPGIAQGAIASSLASHVDVVPTLLDFAGSESTSCTEGVSLKPVLENVDHAATREAVFGELHRGIKTQDGIWWTGQKMIVEERFKYIYYSRAWEGEGFEEELYDLQRDPHELNNIACEEPRRCREMRDRILEWEVNSQPLRLFPVDDRYPLSRFDPQTGKVRYGR